MKSLQNQYNQINEGKGHKDMFLKSARRLFPQYITNFAPYKEVVTILKQKGILNEVVGGVISKPAFNPFQAFNTFINEEAKAIEKKPTTDVVEKETAGFDYKNRDNIDNVYGTSFLQGFYAEMQDPKNAEKSVDELKKIVAKNMAKDFNYYMKNAAFGIKGLGYQTSAESKAPTGKYKSSGYGNLKENLEQPEVKSAIDGKELDLKKLQDATEKAMKGDSTDLALYLAGVFESKVNESDDIKSASKLIAMLKKRWDGKDMEEYFSKKNQEWMKQLEKDLKDNKEFQVFKQNKNIKENKLRSIINTIIREELNESYGMSLEDAKAEAKAESEKTGLVRHVEETEEDSGKYIVSTWYDSDLTVVSYEKGKEKENIRYYKR